ncbi:hypothetical protein [Desulfitibacter alkalitolerans]|uniref:hypothetical protein n=1 Tax=Desulfitibacter alkalitolerans TaxID=264641 RepID=UPI0004894F8B|nr:hypothetical protein [Desulfitibacter alkalitolerans]
MKIGFTKDGLTLNSKKFDPLNITVNGHGIESNRTVENVDPFQLLEGLASCRRPEATRLDQIRALQSVISRFR